MFFRVLSLVTVILIFQAVSNPQRLTFKCRKLIGRHIFLSGIGTDTTLIFGTIWSRLKSENVLLTKKNQEKVMCDLLRETTTPLLITTCTTAAAFFSAYSSSITTIKCFR